MRKYRALVIRGCIHLAHASEEGKQGTMLARLHMFPLLHSSKLASVELRHLPPPSTFFFSYLSIR